MENKALGKRINIARKEKKLTSEQLSEACNINATYLRQIEAGVKTPSLPVFITLCNKLGVSPNYLLYDFIENSQFFEDNVLADLYKSASPNQIKMIVSMIVSALNSMT